jgi:hypothetical protein
MRYRVSFARRFQSDGNESAVDPTADLDVDLPDGVVADKVFVSRFEPESKHSQEVLDEDDAFLGLAAAETWEYDVVDGSEQDFLDAAHNSESVMEVSVVDDTTTDPEDATGSPRIDSGSKAPDEADYSTGVLRGGSGVRSVDDGPGGQPTGDASADGMGPSRPYLANDEVEGISDEGSGGIDDLTVVRQGDPRLGLTNVGKKGPDDWAADTGPTVNPGSGVRSGS